MSCIAEGSETEKSDILKLTTPFKCTFSHTFNVLLDRIIPLLPTCYFPHTLFSCSVGCSAPFSLSSQDCVQHACGSGLLHHDVVHPSGHHVCCLQLLLVLHMDLSLWHFDECKTTIFITHITTAAALLLRAHLGVGVVTNGLEPKDDVLSISCLCLGNVPVLLDSSIVMC